MLKIYLLLDSPPLHVFWVHPCAFISVKHGFSVAFVCMSGWVETTAVLFQDRYFLIHANDDDNHDIIIVVATITSIFISLLPPIVNGQLQLIRVYTSAGLIYSCLLVLKATQD